MKLSTNAQQALDQVIEQFKAGDLSPVVHIARIQHQGEPIPADRWSFSNRILAFIQTGSLDCRGFKQWQQAGRQVRKGEHAAYILAPCLVPVKDDATGETTPVLKGFRAIPVFALHQTDGQPLPEVDYAPAALPPLADVAGRLGIAVQYLPLPADRLGSCDLSGTRIRLGSHEAAVFFHELAHAAHARLEGRLKGGQHADQETVAEFTAAVLMHLYGLGDWAGNCWRYIQGYAADPLQAILKALATVEKILGLLLDGDDLQPAKPEPAMPAEALVGRIDPAGAYGRPDAPLSVARETGSPFSAGNENHTAKETKMEPQLTREMMQALSQPFPAEAIQWKPGATNPDKTRGLALAYVDLRHYIDRLNEVAGPDWSDDYEVQEGGKVVVCRLTLAGVTRSDVGEAAPNEENTATSALAQAFKRACVKFGLGAYLYRLPRTWVEYDAKRKCFTGTAIARLQQAVGGYSVPGRPRRRGREPGPRTADRQQRQQDSQRQRQQQRRPHRVLDRRAGAGHRPQRCPGHRQRCWHMGGQDRRVAELDQKR